MPRTPEQIEAGDALTAAIERLTRAYGYHESGEVNGEWVIVVAQQAFDGEEIDNSYALLLKDGKLSTPHAAGLLDVASFDLKMGRLE